MVSPSPFRPSIESFAYPQDDLDAGAPDMALRLDEQFADYVSVLSFHEKMIVVPTQNAFAPWREPRTAEEFAQAAQLAFASLAFFLDQDANDEDVVRICAAMEWYFDAEGTKNDTIAFLQRCIALEALLGEKKGSEFGLTARLADRLSYLLGARFSQRREWREKFLKVYDARSDIVHQRRADLGEEFATVKKWARDMLVKAIRAEMELLRASVA